MILVCRMRLVCGMVEVMSDVSTVVSTVVPVRVAKTVLVLVILASPPGEKYTMDAVPITNMIPTMRTLATDVIALRDEIPFL